MMDVPEGKEDMGSDKDLLLKLQRSISGGWRVFKRVTGDGVSVSQHDNDQRETGKVNNSTQNDIVFKTS